MPRRARHFKSDSIFHIGCRGVDRQPVFLIDADREFFLAAMAECIAKSDIRTVAYCLMPNHFHWAVATAKTPFDKVVHGVLTRHAVRFNRLHGRTGHLFEQRHWSSACEDEAHIENAISYIHLNPVRAGLVKAPEEWRWSSYREWDTAASTLVNFDRASEVCGRPVDELVRRHRARVETELSGGAKGLTVEGLIADVVSMLGIAAAELCAGTKGDVYTQAKRILIARAEKLGISLVDLADGLRCQPDSLYTVKRRRP